jgi:8-oxo-dGTP pyrophosphatase MutT (NUDIX family)
VSPHESLRAALLSAERAASIEAHGRIEAAVLVPLFGNSERAGLVFTQRREDLRRHAGEISFPGGRREGAEELIGTALREAEEEIGLAPDDVEVIGALPPIGTFVTNYKVHPFVGLIGDDLRFAPNPAEVETVLAFTVDELRGGFAMRRLVRHGIPIRTPTYVVREHLIWGATARIVGELLGRLETPASA